MKGSETKYYKILDSRQLTGGGGGGGKRLIFAPGG
jgi:hypothetical protein